MSDQNKYTCPCCGYKVLTEKPGSFEICPICYWEDEAMQLRYPTEKGANNVCLAEAQINFEKYGVSNQELKIFVRPPNEKDEKDKNWRKVDLKRDKVDDKNSRTISKITIYPDDMTKLYYWEDYYWKNEEEDLKSK